MPPIAYQGSEGIIPSHRQLQRTPNILEYSRPHAFLSKQISTPAFTRPPPPPLPPTMPTSMFAPPTSPPPPIGLEKLAAAHRRLDRTQSEPVPQDQRQLGHSRYKTELCRPYEENGFCKYGEKCQFAHGHLELRSLNRHPKYKTDLCRTFHTIGLCPYGPRCHFVHNAEESRVGDSVMSFPPPPTQGNQSSPLGDLQMLLNQQQQHLRAQLSPPGSSMGGSPPSSTWDDYDTKVWLGSLGDMFSGLNMDDNQTTTPPPPMPISRLPPPPHRRASPTGSFSSGDSRESQTSLDSFLQGSPSTMSPPATIESLFNSPQYLDDSPTSSVSGGEVPSLASPQQTRLPIFQSINSYQ